MQKIEKLVKVHVQFGFERNVLFRLSKNSGKRKEEDLLIFSDKTALIGIRNCRIITRNGRDSLAGQQTALRGRQAQRRARIWQKGFLCSFSMTLLLSRSYDEEICCKSFLSLFLYTLLRSRVSESVLKLMKMRAKRAHWGKSKHFILKFPRS